jgi:hypothetical protein
MPVQQTHWQAVLDRMFEELRSGSPRAEVYWAQQLAFGPVFFYAVVLAVREDAVPPNDRDHLRRIVPLALSLLGALPDGGDSASLLVLAHSLALSRGGAPLHPPGLGYGRRGAARSRLEGAGSKDDGDDVRVGPERRRSLDGSLGADESREGSHAARPLSGPLI